MDGIRPTTTSSISTSSNTASSSSDLSTFILSKNLLRSLPHKKQKKKFHIAKLNSDIDLYTNQKISDVSSSRYHLDHIVELQCFAHVISLGLRNIDNNDKDGHATFSLLSDRLVKIINSDFNLNVTDRRANLVKMNVFKEFIKRRRNDSNPSLISFLRNAPNFDKNIYHFCSPLRNECKKIREQLIFNMNETTSIQHAFKRIID